MKGKSLVHELHRITTFGDQLGEDASGYFGQAEV